MSISLNSQLINKNVGSSSTVSLLGIHFLTISLISLILPFSHHWLQSNLDRLALTFRRNILGIHNPTYGIVFDLLQCLLERDFLYDTQDTRDAHALVQAALQDPRYTKIVLLLHSQGGIEGGLMLDMLLADLPEHALHKLEVYTFASAANHFNNPARAGAPHQRVFAHVEHYANRGDFVSRWGILRFARSNRFAGRVFDRSGSGHLLNQHYLNPMFPLDPATGRVADTNPWVESLVDVGDGRVRPVKDSSRLWAYRNGLSPD